MSRRASLLALLTGLALGSWAEVGRAQMTMTGPSPVPPCTCGGQGPHIHVSPGGTYAPQGRGAARSGTGGINAGRGYGDVAPGAAGPINGLPRGRRYYGGRFFGSFNNRFYGPQYGNF
jgi:hypothetical protein